MSLPQTPRKDVRGSAGLGVNAGGIGGGNSGEEEVPGSQAEALAEAAVAAHNPFPGGEVSWRLLQLLLRVVLEAGGGVGRVVFLLLV